MYIKYRLYNNMIIDNIYKSDFLKYPLNKFEYELIEEVWDFINIFSKQYVFISDYRNYVIKTVNRRYTPDRFLIYESITNKMFWNLRWLISPLWIDENMTEDEYYENIKNNYGGTDTLSYVLLLCKSVKFEDEQDLNKKIKDILLNSTYYRSFINKILIVDKHNSILYAKQLEGSSDIFSKNYFNLLTMTILFDRKFYEEIMKNPYSIKNKKVELSKFYYQYDYGFPNLNFCTYDFGTQDQKLDRITKLYYNDIKHKTRYWFKLIY